MCIRCPLEECSISLEVIYVALPSFKVPLWCYFYTVYSVCTLYDHVTMAKSEIRNWQEMVHGACMCLKGNNTAKWV